MKEIFTGTGVALVTPFKDNQIDFDSMKNLIEKCLKEKAQAFVVLATTGEGVTISSKERKEIILFCKKLINKRAKLIVGTGNNNFEMCFKNTKQAKDLGADAALIVTPYYNKTTQSGLVNYYEKFSNLEFPMIIYNVPARTGLCIELDTIEKIIKSNKYVYGIKESTCDINRIIKLHQICQNRIAVYSGEDALNLIFYSLGSNGAISVTANAFCEKVQNVYELATNNNFKNALLFQNELQSINEILFCETNPIPIKYMLYKQKIIDRPDVRLPLIELGDKNKKKIDMLLKKRP